MEPTIRQMLLFRTRTDECMMEMGSANYGNFIFLICNEILVLIFQTSGFIRILNQVEKNNKYNERIHVSTIKENLEEKGRKMLNTNSNFDDLRFMGKTEENGRKIDDLILSEELEFPSSEIGDEEEENEEELLITDELNKKCKDFIIKVKQGIIMNSIISS
ncbi:Uncharacterized protein Fot_37516 [Forsythia ovata]|uniref:Uncharacterized protein n=1 Tax=Forsythia ovata TaxID=205694 RepID=A0ABD1RZ73_9LAMI